ncbi:hypothetical protein GALMADRAFT_142591 [Galerina marginata CBS 339.88]|uniref:Uncharacterized protein n=1 Tax=Galerina marginata (strain CBS 339.88) TaxID=685588 RepID=A0A067SPP3_GALM3|nr:hypothetical protein GALMADRAFT_142591 [Galerina marginata CBS 339.88]
MAILFILPILLVGVCLAQDSSTTSNLAQPTTGTTQKFYSSTFVNPTPPNIQSEFRANYMQHKFDVNVNHIVSGFIYVSPSQQKIRADGASDGSLEISIFDFKNTTANGTVANSVLSFENGAIQPTCSSFFVAPFVQIVPDNFLSLSNAVFAGTQIDDLYGPVDTWTFSMGNNLQITFFLDSSDTLVRFDFAASDTLRTFTTTRFFNIIPGPVNATIFDTSCH